MGRREKDDLSHPALPAYPAQSIPALRRCRQPVPARVAVDATGRPVRVTTDRRGFAGGSVQHAAGPWKTSGEWWLSRADKAGRAGQTGQTPDGRDGPDGPGGPENYDRGPRDL